MLGLTQSHKLMRMWGEAGPGLRSCRFMEAVSSSLLHPYLFGLGRGLGRDAGAGTLRHPAVSVMRAHQLGRQAKVRGGQDTSTPRGRTPSQALGLTSCAPTRSAPPAHISGPPGPR